MPVHKINSINSTIRKIVLAFLVCGCFVATNLTGVSHAQDLRIVLNGGTVSRATLRPGTTTTIEANRSFSDLAVGDPSVADVVPLSNNSFYVQAKTSGFTNVSVYDENTNLLGVLDIRVQQSPSDIQSAIHAAVPNSDIRVRTKGKQIQLSGYVANAVDLARAIKAAQQFSDKPVINALSVSDVQQVSLEVRVLEARRAAGRDLGIKVRGQAGSGLFGSGSGLSVNEDSTGNPQASLQNATTTSGRILSQNAPFGTLVASVLERAGLRIDLVIDALEQKGLARRLAQPNITTISGESAKFHAGGEVPVPSSISDGQVTYTYRPYGVVLNFIPTVLENSKINIRVLTEVSELDRTLQVNGFPAFTSRKAEAVMELRDGQSFAMAGLLQVVNEREIEQLPWLGNLPILGTLFRSTSYQKQETDLVIVVTPRLVRPSAPNEQLYSPLDATRPSNDPEMFLLGLLEVNKEMLRKFKNGDGIIGGHGHRIDLDPDLGSGGSYALRN